MASRTVAALAALALAAAGSAAAAGGAAPLSLAPAAAERAAAESGGAGELRRRGAGFYLLAGLALGLIVLAGFALFGDDPDSMPASP